MTSASAHSQTTPRLAILDLFAGEGGAGVGYHLAGFEVVGVELERARAKHYPFEVVVGDALEVGAELLASGRFDAVHASPPCQRYSRGNAANDTSDYPDLIGPTRELLTASGLPYVIENVEDAKPFLLAPLMLCGSEFGLTAVDDDGEPLRLQRHRLFESNVMLLGAGGCRHDRNVRVGGVYGGARSDKREAREVRKGGYTPASARVQEQLLGVDWMTPVGRRLCIPPAYTQHLGGQLVEHLTAVAA